MSARRRFALLPLLLAACGAGPDASGTSPVDPADPPAAPAVPPPTGGPIWPLSSKPIAPMSSARWYHTATSLEDGRVLLTGGFPGEASQTAELYDPRSRTWTSTMMPSPHAGHHVAARLADGRVLVVGGVSTSTDVDLFDPATDAWTKAKPALFGHTYGTATLLADGRVLVANGYDALNRAELYNPATGVWTLTGYMTQVRFFHTATRLLDGRVLLVGGGADNLGAWDTWSTAEIYDPAKGAFANVKAMKLKRRAHTATLLADGRVLVAGGTSGGTDNDAGQQLDSALLYVPSNGTWTTAPSLGTARSAHTATLFPNGVVLVAGGIDNTGSAVNSVEAFLDGAWHPVDPMTTDRVVHTATPIADGGVLLAGGIHQATAEVYQLDPDGSPCATGARCASGFCAGAVCCDAACDSGCKLCAVSGFEGACVTSCVDDLHVRACADGSEDCPQDAACAARSCAPYRCDPAAGGCGQACSSVADCAPGYACDPGRRCVPPPDVASDAGACNLVRPLGRGDATPWLGAALLGLALWRARGAGARRSTKR